MAAVKETKGKMRYSLLPPEAIEMACRGFEAGLAGGHHEENDWRNGLEWSKWLDAMMRHVEAFRRGEDIDHSDGKHHWEGVLATAMIIAAHIKSGLGKDDRVKSK